MNERKLAGILVEGRPQEGWAVLGIGLNVDIDEDEFPPELRDTATSLLLGEGAPLIEAMVEGIAGHLDAWLRAPEADVLAAWRKRDALRGREVRWADGSGTAAGVDDSGALVVDTAEGRVVLDAGEVHLLG
jgi:BirA family biotin operon repressor/biotin-[acetyl-CoA-carboxylase] ligase